jgi:hypothetical protein
MACHSSESGSASDESTALLQSKVDIAHPYASSLEHQINAMKPSKESEALKKAMHAENSVIQEARTPSSITSQLVMTGKGKRIEDLQPPVRANVARALKLNPDLALRYLSDSDCHTFLKSHQQQLGLLEPFLHETRGALRGDLCRTAVLLVEGGFYQDLDVQLKLPFQDLVSAHTSFMTVRSAGPVAEVGLLNAVIGAVRESVILNETVREMRNWYSTELAPGKSSFIERDNRTEAWMGPMTLYRGLSSVMQVACPGKSLGGMEAKLEWSCGPHTLRFYKEVGLDCTGHPYHCSAGRANGEDLARYGLVKPDETQSDDSLIGWSRFEGCTAYGCGGGGHELSPASPE